MLTRQQKIDLASRILTSGKALVPDRFPTPNRDTLEAWADVIGTIHVPPEVWPEAVKVWATEMVGDRMCTPREMVQAARTVLSRWESHPQRGQQLRAHRQQLQDERDRQLKNGTFAELRGYHQITA